MSARRLRWWETYCLLAITAAVILGIVHGFWAGVPVVLTIALLATALVHADRRIEHLEHEHTQEVWARRGAEARARDLSRELAEVQRIARERAEQRRWRDEPTPQELDVVIQLDRDLRHTPWGQL